MSSKPHPSYVCSSTFPNSVNQIVKIVCPHIFLKTKGRMEDMTCAEKHGKQRLMHNLSLLFLKCDVTSCSYSKQPQSVVFFFLFQLIHFNQITYLTCDLFILLSHEEVGCPLR